jgi:hypothetical protein
VRRIGRVSPARDRFKDHRPTTTKEQSGKEQQEQGTNHDERFMLSGNCVLSEGPAHFSHNSAHRKCCLESSWSASADPARMKPFRIAKCLISQGCRRCAHAACAIPVSALHE